MEIEKKVFLNSMIPKRVGGQSEFGVICVRYRYLE